jgi:hypothetical protein
MRYLGGVVGVALLGRLVDLAGDRAAVLGEHRTVLASSPRRWSQALSAQSPCPDDPRTASRPGCRAAHDGHWF